MGFRWVEQRHRAKEPTLEIRESKSSRTMLCAAAERIKYDPWQREYRRVAAEVERTGNQSLQRTQG
jgi:hypothetical protein